MKYVALVFLLFFISGCQKERIKKNYPFLEGDFEWIYSMNGVEDSEAYDNENQRYGIRIEGNGRLFFIQNGSKMERFRILTVEPSYSSSIYYIRVKNTEREFSIEATDSTLRCELYPFKDLTNHFNKIR
jgi:hypothetical protein